MADRTRNEHTAPEAEVVMFRTQNARTVLLMAVLVTAVVAGMSGFLLSQQKTTARAADVTHLADTAAQAAFEHYGLPGLAVAVMRGSDLVLAKGYGFADLANNIPVVPDTIFETGSITKQFTAAAIMRLVEEGRVRLDDPIAHYLPDYPTQGRTVLVRHLLSHTSGIQDFIVLPDFWELSADLERSRDELVAMFKNEPFIFEPGARWAYSNSNYTLLGLIIEAVSGQDYADFLEEAFFEPLGLASTRVCDTLPGEERAQGYYLEAGATLAAPAENMAWALGDGAICSSAVDLAAWKRALVTGRVVSHASYERMIAPETLQDGFAPAYGFGLSLVEFGGRPKVAHSGRMGGFSGAVAYYPDDDVIVAILSNLAGIEPETVERTVARAVLGLPEPEVRDLALSPGERQLYLGNFDTGVFPVTISEEGDRLYAEAIGLWPLLYQGDRTFTVEGEADTIRLSFGEEAQSLLLEFAGMHWYAERAP